MAYRKKGIILNNTGKVSYNLRQLSKFVKKKNMDDVNDGYTAYLTIEKQDTFSLLSSVRNGVKYLFFSRIAGELSFTMKEWSDFLHLSERTLQRYKKENRSFDPVYSERILEIALLYKKGVALFGDSKTFDQWLEIKNLTLGGVSPKTLLDTNLGIQLVRDELQKIETGTLA